MTKFHIPRLCLKAEISSLVKATESFKRDNIDEMCYLLYDLSILVLTLKLVPRMT